MSGVSISQSNQDGRSFSAILKARHLDLPRTELRTLQVNVGKLCNQVCSHCHVEAGPKRTEIMDARTARRIVELLSTATSIEVVDFTGGAPELNPHFRYLVREARALGKRILDRCNLTVFYEKGQEDTPQFLADNSVGVVASLPCYSEANVDKQRGRGVFGKSIGALKTLNTLGYGKGNHHLSLDLVYNPLGPSLPPDQLQLEREYKVRLKKDFAIEFDRLYCITNMPIKRFLYDLRRQNKLDDYMDLLVGSFTDEAAKGVMCRSLVSVSWDGILYDCDFNQMLQIPVPRASRNIWNVKSLDEFRAGKIAFDKHCFGCTAGKGSSCGGVTTG